MANYSSIREYSRRILPAVGLLALAGFGNMDVSDKVQSIPSDVHLKNQLVQTLKEAEEASSSENYGRAVGRFGAVYYILSDQHRFSRLPQLKISAKSKSEIEAIAIKTYQNVISELLKKSQEALEKGDYRSAAFFNLDEMRNLPYPVNQTLEEQIRKLETDVYRLGVQKEFEKAEIDVRNGDYQSAITHLTLVESYSRKGMIDLPDGFQKLKTDVERRIEKSKGASTRFFA